MTGTERLSFDTNVLFCAADRSGGERHRLAAGLLARAAQYDAVVILQTLGEFYHAGTRKGAVDHEKARWIIGHWRSVFPVVSAGAEELDTALALREQRSISFWDAMLLATAQSAGCTVLLSEDMQDGKIINGVRIVDPFSSDMGELGL